MRTSHFAVAFVLACLSTVDAINLQQEQDMDATLVQTEPLSRADVASAMKTFAQTDTAAQGEEVRRRSLVALGNALSVYLKNQFKDGRILSTKNNDIEPVKKQLKLLENGVDEELSATFYEIYGDYEKPTNQEDLQEESTDLYN